MVKLKLLLLGFLLPFLGVAQILDPVSWSTSVEETNGKTFLVVTASIEKGWHLYSQYLESDMGPVPTEFTYEASPNYELVGKASESKTHTEYDKNFDMNLSFFSGKAVFKQEIKVKVAEPFKITGEVYYMVCDDEKCLPPTGKAINFNISSKEKQGVKLNPVSEPNKEAVEPESEPQETETEGILEPVKWSFSSKKITENEYEISAKATIDNHWHVYSTILESEDGPIATEFIFDESIELVGKTKEIGDKKKEYDPNFLMNVDFFENEVIFSQNIKIPNGQTSIKGELLYMTCNESKCIKPPTFFEIDLGSSNEIKSDQNKNGECVVKTFEGKVAEKENESYWWFFITAFLFGLTSLLTPCVFPMIPMTVSFFMKDEGKGKRNAIIYGVSIILIYTLIGTLVSVLFGASFSNWLATHWVPNTLFFIVFVVFAASFFGMFEITLPSWLVAKTDKGADRGGLIGTFFMALTLVIVSFSCTGPIVGVILIKASQGAVLEPMIGMLGFSLAFALPFTLFALFPSWLNKLPQSGGWLNSVKVVLGFLELALALKFLSVADQTYHWGILDRHVYIALWIVIFALMGFYLLGKLKFSHDSDLPFISVPRLGMAILVFSFTIYLIPGMFGAPLKELSGYLPPMSTHDFNLLYEEGELLCDDEPKYSDFLHLPHGLQGYFDYDQGMACAKANDKPVFIDFTGHGCVNCRKMEANVWSDPKVLKLLKEEFVVIALYCDDKTELTEDEWYKSKFDGRMKKTIGDQNLDFQICSFNNNAQPLYVLLDNEGELVAQPKGYDTDVTSFYNFLKDGIEVYKTRKATLIK